MRLYSGIFSGRPYGGMYVPLAGVAAAGLSAAGRPWFKISGRRLLRAMTRGGQSVQIGTFAPRLPWPIRFLRFWCWIGVAYAIVRVLDHNATGL